MDQIIGYEEEKTRDKDIPHYIFKGTVNASGADTSYYTITDLTGAARLLSTAAAFQVLSLQFTVKLFYDLMLDKIIDQLHL